MRFQAAGFTLVELLVVILILGIIAGISIIAFGDSAKKSIQSACKTSYQSTLLAIQSYQSDHLGEIPDSISALIPDYVNKNLVDSDNFSFALQSVGQEPGVLVIKTKSAVLQSGTFISNSSNQFTFQMSSLEGIALGQEVQGAGIGSLFSTSATLISGSSTVDMDSTQGIIQGMNVIGDGILEDTQVASVNSATSITLTRDSTFSGNSNLVFGSTPLVSAIDQTSGRITLTVNDWIYLPKINTKYQLIFGGYLVPGTAPSACLKL